jgi:hypothetical protein
MIQVQLNSVAIQWVQQETLPGATFQRRKYEAKLLRLLQFRQQEALHGIPNKTCQTSGRYYTSHVEYKMLYQNMADYQPLRRYERGQAGALFL